MLEGEAGTPLPDAGKEWVYHLLPFLPPTVSVSSYVRMSWTVLGGACTLFALRVVRSPTRVVLVGRGLVTMTLFALLSIPMVVLTPAPPPSLLCHDLGKEGDVVTVCSSSFWSIGSGAVSLIVSLSAPSPGSLGSLLFPGHILTLAMALLHLVGGSAYSIGVLLASFCAWHIAFEVNLRGDIRTQECPNMLVASWPGSWINPIFVLLNHFLPLTSSSPVVFRKRPSSSSLSSSSLSSSLSSDDSRSEDSRSSTPYLEDS